MAARSEDEEERSRISVSGSDFNTGYTSFNPESRGPDIRGLLYVYDTTFKSLGIGYCCHAALCMTGNKCRIIGGIVLHPIRGHVHHFTSSVSPPYILASQDTPPNGQSQEISPAPLTNVTVSNRALMNVSNISPLSIISHEPSLSGCTK